MMNVMQDLVFLLWFALVLDPAGRELTDLVDARSYWKAREVAWTAEAMRAELPGAAGAGAADHAAIDALVAGLGAETHAARREAEERLLATGETALPALRRAGESDDPELALTAREVAGKIASRAAGQAGRRLMAIKALGELGPAGDADLLRRLAASPDRMESALALRALGQPAAPPPRVEPAAALAALPAQVDLAGWMEMPSRVNPKPIPERFANQGLILQMAGQRDLIGDIHRRAAGWLDEAGNIRVHGVAFALRGQGSAQRRVAAVIAADFSPARLEAALARQPLDKVRTPEGTWHALPLPGGLMCRVSENGLIRLDFSVDFAPDWWRPCPPDAAPAGRGPPCWSAAMRESAALAAEGDQPFWFASAGAAGRIWRSLPQFNAVQRVIIRGHAPAGGPGWVFETRLDCDGEPSARELAGRINLKLGDVKKGAAAAAVNLTAFRPVADLLGSMRVEAEKGVVRVSAAMTDTDGTVLALPFLLMMQFGLGL